MPLRGFGLADDSRGLAAVVLPSTILTTGEGPYVEARRELLANFNVRAIVALSKNAFQATSTETIILFLEKYDEPPKRARLVEDSVTAILSGASPDEWEDRAIFDAYVAHVGVSEADYLAFVSCKRTWTAWRDHPYFGAYCKAFDAMAEYRSKREKKAFLALPAAERDAEVSAWFYDHWLKGVERDKLMEFGLVYRQKTLVVKSPDDKNAERAFLGYTWSNRRGQEGIKVENPGGLLYSDADRRAEGTIAAGIRDAFGETPPAIETGAEYAHYLPLRDLIDFSRPKFDVAISLSPHRSVALPPGMVHLEKVCGYVTERVPFEEIVAADYITTDNMLQKRGGVVPYAGNPVPGSVVRYRKGDILISNIRPYLKKIWFADRDGGCSPDVLVLRSKDAKKALPEYLFECASADAFFDYVMEGKSGVKMPRGDKDQILRYPIKDVGLSVQQKVVAECAKIDAACAKLRKQAEADRGEIEAIMGKVFKPFGDAQSGVGFASLHPLVALSDCAEIVRGVTYAKEDQVAERTDCVVLTADNITLGGELSVQKEVFLRKSFQADEQKALKKGDCFICLSSGSRQHVGKVAFVEQDLHCYAGGFMGILRASKGNCLPRYLYEVLNSAVGREVVRQKSGGANIKNLSNSIGEIKIPVPPLGEQEVVVGKVEKLEAAIASAERQLSAASSSKASILARILG